MRIEGATTESSNKKHQSGFSLIEVLVAMVIFLIVTGAIYGLLSIGSVSKNRSSRRTNILKNARAAVHLIGRDALNAGLGYHQQGAIVPDDFLSTNFQLPADADTERDILTAVVAGNDLFTNDLQSSTTERTDFVAFAYRDLDYFNGSASSIDDTVNVSSNPDWTRLETKTNHTSDMNQHDLMLIESDSSQVAVMVSSVLPNDRFDIRPGDPLGLNLPHDGTGSGGSLLKKCTPTVTEHCTTYLASAKRFFLVSYKVKQDGTLVRTLYGNNAGAPASEQVQERPLAYNVKDLQFTYLLSDGTVTDDPAAGPDGIVGTVDDRPNDFNLIRQFTVSLEVQSTELDEQTGQPELIRLSATFSVRNLQYDLG
ncbi:MAG: prepilin-type N-terminal cleavage/methylation domain-containing protein [Pyrinomonadaceae bacterium]|nr:prepilin-type N-terminal cleavage/methylation domain-containing protein [Pyrinomonadaceae bacterium]